MSKFREKNQSFREFGLIALDQDMVTSQIHYHSRKNLSAVIFRLSFGAMASSLFLEWYDHQTHFLESEMLR